MRHMLSFIGDFIYAWKILPQSGQIRIRQAWKSAVRIGENRRKHIEYIRP